MRLAHRLGTSAAVLLLAGCAGGTGASPEVAGEWELLQFTQDGAVVPEPVGGRATLTVGDGELSGTSFCNSYSGSYRLDGDALSVSGTRRHRDRLRTGTHGRRVRLPGRARGRRAGC